METRGPEDKWHALNVPGCSPFWTSCMHSVCIVDKYRLDVICIVVEISYYKMLGSRLVYWFILLTASWPNEQGAKGKIFSLLNQI